MKQNTKISHIIKNKVHMTYTIQTKLYRAKKERFVTIWSVVVIMLMRMLKIYMIHAIRVWMMIERFNNNGSCNKWH